MLKEEFESRIGKRVTTETFREYEKMYLAIDADKDTFCKMLNLDAIPEDPAAVKARAEAAEKIAEARAEVQRLKDAVKDSEAKAKEFIEWWNDRPQAAYYREQAKIYREDLKQAREWLRILTA